MGQPMALCYGMAEDRGNAVAALAKAAGIRAVLVRPSEYEETLDALCGLAPRSGKAHAGGALPGEMMVMAHFPKGLLNQFLDSFHASGTTPVPLKAMRTPNNGSWNALKLYDELSQEYEFFRRLQEQAGE